MTGVSGQVQVKGQVWAEVEIDGVKVFVDRIGGSLDGEGRGHWRWGIDTGPGYRGDALHSGAAGMGDEPVKMLGTLLSFLGAAAEAYHAQMVVKTYVPENINLFPHEVSEWAYLNQDELSMAMLEVEG